MKYFWLTGLYLLLVTTTVQSQSLTHQPPAFFTSSVTTELEFRSTGVNLLNVADSYLFYRYGGDLNFSQIPATVDNNRVIVAFRPDDSATTLEYFLELQLNDGEVITYPVSNPRTNPVNVNIIKQTSVTDSQIDNIDYSILSPEPGTTIQEDDAIVAIAFYYEDEEDANFTLSLLVNGVDVSEDAFMSPYLISYEAPRGTLSGSTSFTIMVTKDGQQIELVNWQANISPRGRTVSQMRQPLDQRRVIPQAQTRAGWLPTGQVEVSARSQSFGGRQDEMARTGFRLSGRDGDIRYSVNGLFTTQEDSRRQPQNRFGAELYVGNWLDLQAGHVYPTLSPLLMSGRRMLGVNTEFRAFNNNLQLQFLYGSLARGINPLYDSIRKETSVILDVNGVPISDTNGDTILNTVFTLPLQSNGFGTYKRDIAGFRIGAGNMRTFVWNLQALRVEDDVNSINVVRNYNDLTSDQLASLTPNERQELEDNQGALDIRRGSQSPQGNFAAATDFQLRLDQGRFQWRTDLGASLTNNDISRGVLTSNRANELGFEIGDDALNAFDRWSWLIVINENMTALPLQLRDGGAEVFFPTSIFMGQTDLNLNYFGHNLNVLYRWVGPDFNSLANIGQRTDIQGYTITDRFRVSNNSIFFTLGHEILWDNVTGVRDATTSSMTNRINLSWYPTVAGLPNISIGARHRIRNNDVDRDNPYLPQNLLNAAVRNATLTSGGEISILPTPRDNTTLQLNASVTQSFEAFSQDHELNLNFAYLNTTDNVFEFGDFVSTSYGLQLVTRYSGTRLRTRIGSNLMFSESTGGLTSVDVISLSAGMDYSLLQNKLNLNLDVAFTQNETTTIPLVTRTFVPNNFDDLTEEQKLLLLYFDGENNPENFQRSDNNTIFLSGGARYSINRNHAVLVNFNYSSISSQFDGFNIPNDHMVQLRYVTNF